MTNSFLDGLRFIAFLMALMLTAGCSSSAEIPAPAPSSREPTCTRAEAEDMAQKISEARGTTGVFEENIAAYRKRIHFMTKDQQLRELTTVSRIIDAYEAMNAGDLMRACAQFRKVAEDELIYLP